MMREDIKILGGNEEKKKISDTDVQDADSKNKSALFI